MKSKRLLTIFLIVTLLIFSIGCTQKSTAGSFDSLQDITPTAAADPEGTSDDISALPDSSDTAGDVSPLPDSTNPADGTFPDNRNFGGKQPGGMPDGTAPSGIPAMPDGTAPSGVPAWPDGTIPDDMPAMPDGTAPSGVPAWPDGTIPDDMPAMPDGTAPSGMPAMPDGTTENPTNSPAAPTAAPDTDSVQAAPTATPDSGSAAPDTGSAAPDSGSAAAEPTAAVSVIPVSTGDAASGYNLSADAIITLNGSSVSISGTGATANGSVVTITNAGTYLVSGTLTDGQILVNTTDEAKVKLILNGVDIYCSNSAPIYVLSSPKKTEIVLFEGSVNKLSDGTEYILSTDEAADNPSAVIYSRDDLELEGDGTLIIDANYCKGIFSKDDLVINSGTITVTAVDDGIRGKDSVTVNGGSITITADGDGLRTSNETDTTKGYIIINSGALNITAQLDAIQAITDLTVNGGTIKVTSGGGSANASTKSGDDWGNWGGGRGGFGGWGKSDTGSTTTTETKGDSAKGLKAGNSITIAGGTIITDTSDDSIHSNNLVTISGGSMTITSGDDGVHADDTLSITSGSTNITKSYEGLEATHINISGGSVWVTASDDGINAAGGNDASATTNRTTGRGMGMFSSSTGDASFSGGYVIINATGDGIDVNGSAAMTGGYYVVYGPTNSGNGALDYDGSFTVNGGTLISLGSSGMAQSVTSTSQGVLAFTVSLSAGTLMNITDEKGNELLTVETPKTVGCAVITMPELESGEACNISTGGSYSITGSDGLYSGGTYTGGTVRGTLTAN